MPQSTTNTNPAVTTIFDGGRATSKHLRKSRLVVLTGPDAGREFEVSKARASGGRSVINDININDKAVSGAHFEVVGDDHGYRLVDLDSTNGTFVDDLRIKEVYLKPGTRFRVGHTEFQFQPLKETVQIQLSKEDRFGEVLGASANMREIFAVLEKVAPSDLTVLISGETGTGKELIARSIHDMSTRRNKPFVVLDCGAIPKDLIESTLFGHEKGAFTGAIGQHRGCFEQADGGTILLDEIGELNLGLQPKLLRVLENREIKRVGGDRTIPVDVRVIAATNRDLRAMVNKSDFREDLFFRLSVIAIEAPPLRDRRDDIPRLVHFFLKDVSERRGEKLRIDVDAMHALMGYEWPGNVRELRNVIERAGSLCDGTNISRTDLVVGRSGGAMTSPLRASARAGAPVAPVALGDAATDGLDASLFVAGVEFKDAKLRILDVFERRYLAVLLQRNKGNITRSAQEAGLTRYHLRELLKRHHLPSKA